jgi:hypothetical protein
MAPKILDDLLSFYLRIHPKVVCLSTWIYGDGHFIYEYNQKIPVSENSFIEVDILRCPSPKIAINRGGHSK